MSLFDYEASRDIAAQDPPFDALIMAAMRRADTANMTKLWMAFPELGAELQDRYNAPGGRLPSESS